MRCWESPGDLPFVIKNFVSIIKFLSLVEDHPVFPKNVCKNILMIIDLLLHLNITMMK
jgi:hypothetical protein